MRKKIRIGLVSSNINAAAAGKESAQQMAAIAFTLSFDYTDPVTAQQVADELVTRFLDEDLKERREQAKSTSEFLAVQIAALETSMGDQEKRIAAFHEAHSESRPEALMFNQQAVESSMLGMQGLDSQMTANEGTQGALRAQLAVVDPYSRVIANGQVLTTPAIQLKALEAQYSTLTAQYGPDHPDVVKARHQIASLKAQIDAKGGNSGKKNDEVPRLKAQIIDVETNLETSKQTKGADNPDVQALQNQLDSLKKQLAEAGNGSAQDNLKEDADNPAYLELVAQLKSAEEQHKALQEQKQALEKQHEKYQQALAETPTSEKELATLTRDYENAQLRYRDMKEKKMGADMDQQMVQDRMGQRLIVIDPPKLPLRTQPARILLLMAAFLLALAAGIGNVVVAEAMGQSIHGVRHLASLVGEVPLVIIPYIYTPDEKGRLAITRHRIYQSAFIIIVIVALTVTETFMPLEVLWNAIAQHLGLR